MAGAAINNPPRAFDPFAYNAKQQTFADFNPSLYYVSPLEDYNATDPTSDSAPSPGSPVSPMFAAPYALPMDNDWLSWGDKAQQLSNPFVRPNDPYDSPILSSVPARSLSVSPAINPLDLSNSAIPDDVVPFGQEGLNDNIPLFQTAQPAPVALSRPQQPQQQQQQQQQQQLAAAAAAPAGVQVKREEEEEGEEEEEEQRQRQQQQQQQQQQLSEPRRFSARNQQQQQQRKLKRKSTTSSSSRSSASPPPASVRRTTAAAQAKAKASSPPAALGPKKTAHNMIEKRYRTNLNDKIAALRDAVPALRVTAAGRADGHQDDLDEYDMKREGSTEEDLGGLAPAHKLNKATILSKATEYIAHLESKNQMLAGENADLRGRVEGFETMMMSRGDEGECAWA